MANKPRPKMPVSDRAKQFAPFAALRGLEAALERKRREMLPPDEPLSEYRREMLDCALLELTVGTETAVTVRENGETRTVRGAYRGVNTAAGVLLLGDDCVPLAAVTNIETNADRN